MSDHPVALITGGAGFLGSHLVDLLMKNDFHVKVMDNFSNGSRENLKQWEKSPRFEVKEMDIYDLEENDSFFQGLDYIFHLAGIEDSLTSLKDPIRFMNTNVIGSAKVMNAAKQSKLKKFVFAGSSASYGIPNTPTLESDGTGPLTPSGLSKLQAEEVCFHWGEVFDIPVTAARIYNAYGPRCLHRQHSGQLFSIWMKQKLSGEPLSIFGKGEEKQDFIYCTDVANALYTLALEGEDGEFYNVGSGKPVSLSEFASMISEKINCMDTLEGKAIETWADLGKIEFKTSWAPKVPLEKGLEFSLQVINDWEKATNFSQEKLDKYQKEWKSFFP